MPRSRRGRSRTAPFSRLWAATAVSDLGDGVTLAAGPLLMLTLSSDPVIIGPYPNPVSDYVNLDVILPKKGRLQIHHFNTMGNKLGMMADGQMEKGYHRIFMETRGLYPGIYILKVEFNEYVEIVKYLVR